MKKNAVNYKTSLHNNQSQITDFWFDGLKVFATVEWQETSAEINYPSSYSFFIEELIERSLVQLIENKLIKLGLVWKNRY